MAADKAYQSKVYRKQGGDTLIVADGGVIEIESGGTLQLDSGAVATLADSILAAADIALAEGSVFVGNVSGVASALNAKTNGAILIGNGTTITSNAITGDITLSNAGLTAIASTVIVDADINAGAAISFSKLAALPSTQILLGSAGNVCTATAVTGDVTIGNTGVTAIATGVIVDADIHAAAAIASSKLAANANLAAMVSAGMANSASYIRTDSGTKTLLAANATKDRGVIAVVYVDTTFATGDGSQPVVKVGETDTIEKGFAAAKCVDAAAGTYFVTGFLNTATKAIVATLTAATGATSTGAYSITVFALPNS